MINICNNYLNIIGAIKMFCWKMVGSLYKLFLTIKKLVVSNFFWTVNHIWDIIVIKVWIFIVNN